MRVLITGISASGKSTVAVALAARGHRVVDLDAAEWSRYADDGDWVWREDRVGTLLATDDAPVLILSGCAANQVRFYPQIDCIVLLTAPEAVIVERLATRTTNDFGKSDAEREHVLRTLREIEPLLRRIAHEEVDSTAPLERVVAEILRIAGVGS
jgi:adenylate kinase family enzyme